MSSLEIRVDPGAMGFEPARLERIRPHFDAYVEDRRLAGWLATVARGGELVWTAKGGYRDREKDLEVTDDTIWRIYSMTKPITSIAVMMLYEEGRFDLNDDVGDHESSPSHLGRERIGARRSSGVTLRRTGE